jgi:hypothetical protein
MDFAKSKLRLIIFAKIELKKLKNINMFIIIIK